jgi:pseudaminic acid biosynthesis-associated methylase
MNETKSEVERLESLWSGQFGDDYVDRNAQAHARREPFWREQLAAFPATRILEVGCNNGTNLRWISQLIAPEETWGVDINQKALQMLRRELPDINTVTGQARDLPFRDRWFDMVFTMGVLIHQPPQALPLVMSEIVRCSRRYLLCGEYYAEQPTEVPYRGQTAALFKCDFGGLYRQLFPGLQLRKQGFLSRAEGWDEVTYWVFEKLA